MKTVELALLPIAKEVVASNQAPYLQSDGEPKEVTFTHGEEL